MALPVAAARAAVGAAADPATQPITTPRAGIVIAFRASRGLIVVMKPLGRVCLACWLAAAGAVEGTETWYDSKGTPVEVARLPELRPEFVPQWVAREAARDSGAWRTSWNRTRFGAVWGWGSVHPIGGWWGHRVACRPVWVRAQRPWLAHPGGRSGIRVHSGTSGGGRWNIQVVAPGFRGTWVR